MNSYIYRGEVGHKRYGSSANRFSYPLFLMYLDLDELDDVFKKYWLWSTSRPAPARFRRADHCGDPQVALADDIRSRIAAQTGRVHEGPIRLLTHLAYFGHCFNPLSVYYCFDQTEQITDVILEVSNTPWGETHCYVLNKERNLSGNGHHHRFSKEFHVSPFLPMEMEYSCRFTEPDEQLYLSISNYREDRKCFTSQLTLKRQEISSKNLALALAVDPLATLRVVTLIHWQAFKLWRKKAPWFSHPGTSPTANPKQRISAQ